MGTDVKYEPDPDEVDRAVRDRLFDYRVEQRFRAAIQSENDDSSQSCWAPEDLSDVIDGEIEDLMPRVLLRTDGLGLLYPGCTHSLHGPTGSAKSWIGLHATAQEVLSGNNVLYIDYEASKRRIVNRLRLLGVTGDAIKARLDYVRPTRSPELLDIDRTAFTGLLGNRYSLAVIDGANISMALCGLNTFKSEDVARWHALILNPVAERTGAATVAVDHVAKGNETSGFAYGSQHKLAGLTGAGYTVERVEPFGRGRCGTSTIRVGMKDREGVLSGVGLDDGHPDGLLVGAFQLDATGATTNGLSAALLAPDSETVDLAAAKRGRDKSKVHGGKGRDEGRPTAEMVMVSAYWEEMAERPDERSTRKTVEALRARATARNEPMPAKNRLEQAAAILKDQTLEGGPYAKAEGPQGRINTSIKKYVAQNDPLHVDTSAWAARHGL